MNKLRTFGASCGFVLLSAAAFGAATYGVGTHSATLALVVCLAGGIVALPTLLSWVRRTLGRRRQDLAGSNARSGTKDRYYVANEGFTNRDGLLDAVREVVDGDGRFERGSDESFPEGTGLSIRHGGFHASFVRVDRSGRLVLSGASGRTGDLAAALAARLDVTFDRSWSNPMRRRTPVAGGTRVVLAALFLTATVVGVGSVAAAGYPSAAYNPAEKIALSSFDAKAALVPGTTPTDAAIQKARFRISALNESVVEVDWEGNDSRRVLSTSRHALVIAGDTRATLETLRERDLSPRQAAEVDTLKADLRDNETHVATKLETRAERGNATHSAALRSIAGRLRSHDASTSEK